MALQQSASSEEPNGALFDMVTFALVSPSNFISFQYDYIPLTLDYFLSRCTMKSFMRCSQKLQALQLKIAKCQTKLCSTRFVTAAGSLCARVVR